MVIRETQKEGGSAQPAGPEVLWVGALRVLVHAWRAKRVYLHWPLGLAGEDNMRLPAASPRNSLGGSAAQAKLGCGI